MNRPLLSRVRPLLGEATLVQQLPHAEIQQTHSFLLGKMKECVQRMDRHRVTKVPWGAIQKDDPKKYEELMKGWKENMAEIEAAVEKLQYALREWK